MGGAAAGVVVEPVEDYEGLVRDRAAQADREVEQLLVPLGFDLPR